MTKWEVLPDLRVEDELGEQLSNRLAYDSGGITSFSPGFRSLLGEPPSLEFAQYGIDRGGRVLVRGAQLWWRVSAADLVRACYEGLNDGDPRRIFVAIEDYGHGGNGHETWEHLLDLALDETQRQLYWVGVLAVAYKAKPAFNRVRYGKARAQARKWSTEQGLTCPSELRRFVDRRGSWKLELLSRRLDLPVEHTRVLLKRLGYTQPKWELEWRRSESPKAIKRRRQWLAMERGQQTSSGKPS